MLGGGLNPNLGHFFSICSHVEVDKEKNKGNVQQTEKARPLRRFPLNVRAVSTKIKLPKKYLQHCHILRTDKKNLSLLLLPS